MQLLGLRAKPFLKWAGGKTQLLPVIQARLPLELENGKIKRYVEPFIGGGAVFFYLTQFYNFDEIIISDVNVELLIVYKSISEDVAGLTEKLNRIKKRFLAFKDEDRYKFYYEQRNSYNQNRTDYKFDHFRGSWLNRAAQFIFLNHTCFNGLYRTNSKSLFNVPFGKYEQPAIFDEHNLKAVSELLSKVKIMQGDFELSEKFTDDETFVYFDPPYRPISKTSNFSTYHKETFSDEEQKRVASLFRKLDSKGAKLMLSNSDPKNENPDDEFFDELYKGFRIERVKANRMINSKGAKRGQISELLIMNY